MGSKIVKPGITNSKKMNKLIELALKETMDNHEGDLDVLLSLIGDLEYLVISWRDPKYHISQLTNGKFSSLDSIPENTKRSIILSLRFDSSLLAFFDMWRELGTAIRDLISSNYDSISRSLRLIIETCIFWADIQLDEDLAADHFEYYNSNRISGREFIRLQYEIGTINEVILTERLLFKEKYKSPSVSEILNNINVIKGDNKYSKGIKEEINKYYKYLSKYSHYTEETLKEVNMEELHGDFAYFLDYKYKKTRFQEEINNIYNTVDLVISTMILVETNFLKYDTPNTFFNMLGDEGLRVREQVTKLQDLLPHLYNIIINK
jgi:hypothetical protein